MKNMEKVFFGTMAVAFVTGVVVLILAAQPVIPDQPSPALSEADAMRARNAAQSVAPPAGVSSVASAPTNSLIQAGKDGPARQLSAGEGLPAPAQPVSGKTGPAVKPPAQDPLARMALPYVGMDSEAEAYWLQAINDPNLPAQERQDLIEDLNQDGLSDPRHPSVADLPLIISRLMLIETLAPDAMDQVNANAFQEAYRDLSNLANVALGAGEPVQ